MPEAGPFWSEVEGVGPLVAFAIHAGHALRDEVRQASGLDDAARLREEDPHTDALASVAATRVVVHRSRFEVDVNRPRDKAVYGGPADAWGLEVWSAPPPPLLITRSLAEYDEFYASVRRVLDGVAERHRYFVVLDVHSYNHRRGGPSAEPDDPVANPDVNVGTESIDTALFGPLVERFMRDLAAQPWDGRTLDVRENVKFRGGNLSRWVNDQYRGRGCAIAIEFKKTFMNEWTGEVSSQRLAGLRDALAAAVPGLRERLSVMENGNGTGDAEKMYNGGRRGARARRPIRIGFVVNDIMTEEAGYTTTRLAMAARRVGHEAWTMGVGDLAYDPDEKIRAKARTVPKQVYKDGAAFLKDLQGRAAITERITVDDLDILMLRNDPSPDATARPWASNAGIIFGRVAMRHGVIVLNDPNGLAKATSKMYFQTFPAAVRPRTLITRDRDDIKHFAKEQGGKIVLKPLQGSGGQNVFLVRPEDVPNINQMFDAVSRDGFVIAQEYLPRAESGDMRLFLMNGEPLRHKGHYAAFRRVRRGGDMRSNVHAGGGLAAAEVTVEALELVEMVRPKLVQDGMFLVGLDIVGDKLMEINVFSPGGLGSAQKFEHVNFADAVIRSLERKVGFMGYYDRFFDNVEMATL